MIEYNNLKEKLKSTITKENFDKQFKIVNQFMAEKDKSIATLQE